MSVRHAAAGLAALCALPALGVAQSPAGPRPGISPAPAAVVEPAPARAPLRVELRAEHTAARVPRMEGSAGIVLPFGTYVRVALTAGAGTGGTGDDRFSAWRGDAVVRFQLDPFRQARAGVYGGAGVAWLGGPGRAGTARLALGAGVELPELGPVAPALELALAGGVRAGVALRSASRRWR